MLIGIDIGGTKMLGAALSEGYELLGSEKVPTPSGLGAIFGEITSMVSRLTDTGFRLGYEGPIRLGIGIPGMVGFDGVVKGAANLREIEGSDFEAGYMSHLATSGVEVARVAFGNDATCAALAEWKLGAASGAQNVLVVTLGSGIGGGLVTEGALLLGASGYAGEIGHMVVDPNGPECPCGNKGCWERLASGNALGEIAKAVAAYVSGEKATGGQLLDEHDGLTLDSLRGSATETSPLVVAWAEDAISGLAVSEAATSGDPLALAVVSIYCRKVSIGLANLVEAMDPQIVVVGGGVAASPGIYLEPLVKAFDSIVCRNGRRSRVPLAFAKLGEKAGAIGAAILAEG